MFKLYMEIQFKYRITEIKSLKKIKDNIMVLSIMKGINIISVIF